MKVTQKRPSHWNPAQLSALILAPRQPDSKTRQEPELDWREKKMKNVSDQDFTSVYMRTCLHQVLLNSLSPMNLQRIKL